jgi:hypothetical protein
MKIDHVTGTTRVVVTFDNLVQYSKSEVGARNPVQIEVDRSQIADIQDIALKGRSAAHSLRNLLEDVTA